MGLRIRILGFLFQTDDERRVYRARFSLCWQVVWISSTIGSVGLIILGRSEGFKPETLDPRP